MQNHPSENFQHLLPVIDQIPFSKRRPSIILLPTSGQRSLNWKIQEKPAQVFDGLVKMRQTALISLNQLTYRNTGHTPENGQKMSLVFQDRISLIDDLIKSYGYDLL